MADDKTSKTDWETAKADTIKAHQEEINKPVTEKEMDTYNANRGNDLILLAEFGRDRLENVKKAVELAEMERALTGPDFTDGKRSDVLELRPVKTDLDDGPGGMS